MNHRRLATGAVSVVVSAAVAVTVFVPSAAADNRRLNDSVAANVYTVQQQAGCPTTLQINPKLRLAAQWHANDVLHNPALNGEIGSDGSSPQDRANAAGYRGSVAQTVAINPALAINAIEVMRQWYYNPQDMAVMSDCANTDIGVWSENSLARSVVVAVYGRPV